MKNKDEFVNTIVEKLKDFYGTDAEVSTQNIIKTNDTMKIGVLIKFNMGEKNGIAPVIYLDSYYEDYIGGEDIDVITEQITDIAEESNDAEFLNDAVSELQSWEKCKDKIYPVLISTERNSEMLQNLVSTAVLDLSSIYIVRMQLSDATIGTVKITNDLLNKWGITIEELHATAISNMENDEYKAVDIKKLIFDMDDDEKESCDLEYEMLVLTNDRKMYAAAGVLNTEFMSRIVENRRYYMIPSSVHEWIMIPESDNDITKLLNYNIQDVNKTLDEKEVLSDHVYFYSVENGLEMCA